MTKFVKIDYLGENGTYINIDQVVEIKVNGTNVTLILSNGNQYTINSGTFKKLFSEYLLKE